MQVAGQVFGALIAIVTWSLPLAMDYLDHRFQYVKPVSGDLALALVFGAAALVFAAGILGLIHTGTRNGLVLKGGQQQMGGVRLLVSVMAMSCVAIIGMTWAEVARALYPYAADVFDYGLLGLMMLLTLVPPFLAGCLVGIRVGEYPFTIVLAEEKAG